MVCENRVFDLSRLSTWSDPTSPHRIPSVSSSSGPTSPQALTGASGVVSSQQTAASRYFTAQARFRFALTILFGDPPSQRIGWNPRVRSLDETSSETASNNHPGKSHSQSPWAHCPSPFSFHPPLGSSRLAYVLVVCTSRTLPPSDSGHLPLPAFRLIDRGTPRDAFPLNLAIPFSFLVPF